MRRRSIRLDACAVIGVAPKQHAIHSQAREASRVRGRAVTNQKDSGRRR
jgi:hypothetical protein